jgi:formylglycine-generating enzyme required for sulfatase activity
MARVVGGELLMGSEVDGPPHPVKLAPFCVDLTEVTAGDYAACVARKACPAPSSEADWPDLRPAAKKGWSAHCTYGKKDRLDHPMNCVTFEEAAAFCRQAGKRLPDEAQWEYAARGTDGRPYPWGREPPTSTRLNACDEGCAKVALGAETEVIGARLVGDDGAEATSPVGRYLQGVSPFGAFDLAGNVAEWVDATYCPYGQGSCSSTARVIRGGSWTTLRPYALTTSSRGQAAPGSRMPDVGFRCVE